MFRFPGLRVQFKKTSGEQTKLLRKVTLRAASFHGGGFVRRRRAAPSSQGASRQQVCAHARHHTCMPLHANQQGIFGSVSLPLPWCGSRGRENCGAGHRRVSITREQMEGLFEDLKGGHGTDLLPACLGACMFQSASLVNDCESLCMRCSDILSAGGVKGLGELKGCRESECPLLLFRRYALGLAATAPERTHVAIWVGPT